MADHSSSAQTTTVAVSVANPSSIGLLGLALVTLVACSQKLGLTSGTSLVIPWALFLGAAAQVYAGAIDAKLGNVFGATAFFGYGFFWFAVSCSWMIQNGVFGEQMQANADASQLGVAFFGYLIFTLFMTVGAMETNKVLFIIFLLIDGLFLGLSLSSFGIMEHFFHQVAAYSELLISLVSFYGCAANVLNATFKREFLPLGKPFGIFTAKQPVVVHSGKKVPQFAAKGSSK